MKCEEKIEKVRAILNDVPEVGDLSVVVLHRGWVFVGLLAGDTASGFTLSKCENVRSWSQGGFGGMTRGAKTSGAKLDKCQPLTFDAAAMIFTARLPEGWHNA
jgi:hypothetical protein